MAISQWPRGATLLVTGKFKTDLEAPEGRTRDKEIAEVLSAAGLEDMSGHFLPRQKLFLKGGMTCCKIRGGRKVRSRTNYILGTDHHLLRNVRVWDEQHNMEHYLVLG